MRYFLMILACITFLHAKTIDVNMPKESILEHSDIYIDRHGLTLDALLEQELFQPNTAEHINLGFVKNTSIWIRFTLHNDSDKSVLRLLDVANPLLQEVVLYEDGRKRQDGGLHKTSLSLNSSYEIEMKPQETKTYYLHAKNETTALRLGLFIYEKFAFWHAEQVKQSILLLSFGIVLALFIYNFILFLYTQGQSYLLYCVYLIALIWQQLTYLGLTQLYFPSWFVYYDDLAVVLKVNILYIIAAIFAMSFLQTKHHPELDRIYKIIIVVALIEIPLFGMPSFYYPEVGVLTGFMFVLFNIYASIVIYRRGLKQARLFVTAWVLLVVGYGLMIFDGIGIISVMHEMPFMLLYLTLIEAILLSLAFTDEYIILRDAKEQNDAVMMQVMKNHQDEIEREIEKKTASLNQALQSKKVLLKELHHRTKNNLQLIISLIRMQKDTSKSNATNELHDLEHRISAIAKTHELLYMREDLGRINMNEYIELLCDELEAGIEHSSLDIKLHIEDIYMPLKEASYVGLVVNELVTNAVKYAECDELKINIAMYIQVQRCYLHIEDNGIGCDKENLCENLGIGLVRTLVEDQLDGELSIDSSDGMAYKIEFDTP